MYETVMFVVWNFENWFLQVTTRDQRDIRDQNSRRHGKGMGERSARGGGDGAECYNSWEECNLVNSECQWVFFNILQARSKVYALRRGWTKGGELVSIGRSI